MAKRPSTPKPTIHLESPADTAEELFSQLLGMVDLTVDKPLIDPINCSLNNASEALNIAFFELGQPKHERTYSDATLCQLVWSAYLKLETVKQLVTIDYEQQCRRNRAIRA